MQFIGFRDSCVISRATGNKDEWDNPERTPVYDGECLYEEGGTGYARSIITRRPTIFIPDVKARIMINDYVEITTEFGRNLKAVVETVRDINMPWRANVKVTRIELKQAQGD